jgi:gamma-glutamyltranspeptidase
MKREGAHTQVGAFTISDCTPTARCRSRCLGRSADATNLSRHSCVADDGPGHAGIGEPTVNRQGVVAGDTCHDDVVDRWGNMVSATPSGGWLQSSPVIPELGFCLGSRMQMFWLEEGLPASLAAGKRPRSTLSPSLAFKDGEPYLAFGTPGGDQQDQWSLLMFLHHVHHGMNLQEAIDSRPSEWVSNRLFLGGLLPSRARFRFTGHRQ